MYHGALYQRKAIYYSSREGFMTIFFFAHRDAREPVWRSHDAITSVTSESLAPPPGRAAALTRTLPAAARDPGRLRRPGWRSG